MTALLSRPHAGPSVLLTLTPMPGDGDPDRSEIDRDALILFLWRGAHDLPAQTGAAIARLLGMKERTVQRRIQAAARAPLSKTPKQSTSFDPSALSLSDRKRMLREIRHYGSAEEIEEARLLLDMGDLGDAS